MKIVTIYYYQEKRIIFCDKVESKGTHFEATKNDGTLVAIIS